MSDSPAGSSGPTDDFIHVSLIKDMNPSLTDSFSSSKSQYSQVVFHELSEVYPTDGDITFTYSYEQSVIPQVGDRIALYKIGWSSVSEYVASVFAKIPDDRDYKNYVHKVTFAVESLPKDEVNMYQFCYITSGNIVAGSSIPFTFRKPHGSELVAVEDPNDSGLVVFRSRVTQLQEKLEISNCEKEVLLRTVNELQTELSVIKAELNEKIQKCELHKENLHDMTTVIYDLNSEKKDLLEKLNETSELKMQVTQLDKSLKELGVNMNTQKDEIETYKKSILAKDKTIQSLKEEISKLMKTIDMLNKVIESSEKDSKANTEVLQVQLKEANETISHFKSNMNLLESQFEEKLAELKSNYETNKKMYEETLTSLRSQLNESRETVDQLTSTLVERDEQMKNKSELLSNKIKEITSKNQSYVAENLILNQDVEKLHKQIKTLEGIIEGKDETMRGLADTSVNENECKKRLVYLEDENSLLQVQVLSFEERLQSCETENRHISEQNKQLKEEKILMGDQLSKMNEALRKYKLKSRSENPSQSSSQSSSHSSDQQKSGCSSGTQKGSFPFSQFIPFFTPFNGGVVNVKASHGETPPNAQPQASDCDKCQELDTKVKSLMMEKADIRSDLIQTKHSNEECSKHLREVNEEAAALRSRIAVLEIELRKAKEVSITNQGEQKFNEIIGALSTSWKKDEPMQASTESLKMDTVVTQKLEKELQKELQTKVLLQRNVEALMLSEAKNVAAIDNLKKENAKLSNEFDASKNCQGQLDQVVKALDDMEKTKNEILKNYNIAHAEKTKLEAQLIELMKESVGKVSLNTVQKLRQENEELKKQLIDKECSKNQDEVLVAAQSTSDSSKDNVLFDHGVNGSADVDHSQPTEAFVCPVCYTSFPPNSFDAYNKHFGDHFD